MVAVVGAQPSPPATDARMAQSPVRVGVTVEPDTVQALYPAPSENVTGRPEEVVALTVNEPSARTMLYGRSANVIVCGIPTGLKSTAWELPPTVEMSPPSPICP